MRCKICGLYFTSPSLGGSDVCAGCDCGQSNAARNQKNSDEIVKLVFTPIERMHPSVELLHVIKERDDLRTSCETKDQQIKELKEKPFGFYSPEEMTVAVGLEMHNAQELQKKLDAQDQQIAAMREALEKVSQITYFKEHNLVCDERCIACVVEKTLSTSPTTQFVRVESLGSFEELSGRAILDLANNNKPIPFGRALATFANPFNWTQLYDAKGGSGYEPKACEWAFIGPMRPPYELAQHGMKNIEALLQTLRGGKA